MKRAFSALYEVEDESDDDANEANRKSKSASCVGQEQWQQSTGKYSDDQTGGVSAPVKVPYFGHARRDLGGGKGGGGARDAHSEGGGGARAAHDKNADFRGGGGAKGSRKEDWGKGGGGGGDKGEGGGETIRACCYIPGHEIRWHEVARSEAKYSNPNCSFLVHTNASYGSFCCVLCAVHHNLSSLRKPKIDLPPHGQRGCEGRVTLEGTMRAVPIRPEMSYHMRVAYDTGKIPKKKY